MPDYMLGKLPPRHDPRTLRLERYIDLSALPAIPAARSWSHGITDFGMMGNDRIGDCTCAAAGHQIQIWTANSASEVTISDPDVIAAYSAVTGYNPQTGANDNGAVELDVLRYWQQVGIGGHKLGAYADVRPSDHRMVQAAIDIFGGVYIGIALPNSAKAQMGGVWDIPAIGLAGDGAPGSWGGHAVNNVDYDETGPVCITWRFLQKITWAFWDAYVDECHVLFSKDWLSGALTAPSGVDMDGLRRDLAIVSGLPDPGPAPTPPTPPTPPVPPTPTPPVPPTPQPPTPPTPPIPTTHCTELAAPVMKELSDAAKAQPRSTAARYRLQGAQMVAAAIWGQ